MLVLCLLLSFSLSLVPAFADGTVIVVGGTLKPDTGSTVVTQNSAASAAVISGSGNPVVTYDSAAAAAASSGGANTVIVTGNAPAPSQSATAANGTEIVGSVVVMPNGATEAVSANPAPQAQAQQTQTASAQTAASAPVVVAQQTQTAAAQATNHEAPAGLAKDIVDQVNAQRAANGLPALSYSDALQASADTRAKESAELFSHLRPDGRGCETAVTVDYVVTGENLIQVTTEFATAPVMIETWMNSPTHRNNILLAGFSEMAVGIYVSNGITYVSTVFAGY